MYSRLVINFFVLSSLFVSIVWTHGRMNEPAARNTAWRFGFNTPPNYNDNELNCGGAGVQHSLNGGKCGICGDSYAAKIRQHEAGGKYATGTITATYTIGQIIDVNILLTSNHLGFMEFRLCPVNNAKIEASQECLDKNLLKVVGRGTSYAVKGEEKDIKLKLKLPDGLTCSQCVLQWKYKASNNWGKDKNSGKSGLGLGPQEEFFNCADISIKTKSQASNSILVSQTQSTTAFKKPISTRKSSRPVAMTTTFQIKPVETDNAYTGQILCAVKGFEKDQDILYEKVKNCLENCSSPEKTCPNDCLCIWVV